jgi:uncharacterized protein (TIGR02246 family)
MNNKAIEKLYEELLTGWNKQDAKGMASLFTSDAIVIGFDGSQMIGQTQIEAEMKQVFSNHRTAAYVWKIKQVRFLNPEIALLNAIVGMVPPDKKEIDASKNAIQCLVVVSRNNVWKIALFQNTPAQFHGRPQLVEEMTKELTANYIN